MSTDKALFIAGHWADGSGPNFKAEDPATGIPNWSGAAADKGDVDQAIQAARYAFPGFAALGADRREAMLSTYRDLLKSHADDLAQAISSDSGKPLWEAKTEAAAMAGKIDISVTAYHERTGERANELAGANAVLRHRPHGVVAVYGPYNFPGHLANGHIVPALIAGNTVVFKPSELAPVTAALMVRLLDQAGMPKGVVNLVQGGVETGAALAANEGIDALFFTGSAATGALLHKQAGGNPGRLMALELGGNNPLVAWDVHKPKAAAGQIALSAFLTAGQRCTCARRLIVGTGKNGDAVIDALIAVMDTITVGAPGQDPEPFMGPVISNRAADALLKAQADLVTAGAVSLRPLRRPDAARPFLTPGLIDVTGVDVPDEELFGPILQIIRVDDFAEAIEVANATRFGLAAGLIGGTADHWETFRSLIRAGIVNWNRQLTGASSAAPFGGVGASGNHRPAAYYAADYCSYPMASLETAKLEVPAAMPGITL